MLRKVFYFVVVLGIFAGCRESDGEETGMAYNNQLRLDSVTYGNEVLMAMDYDKQGRVTLLTEANGYHNVVGYDSTYFSYPDAATIVVDRSWLYETTWYHFCRKKSHSTFRLKNGLVSQTVTAYYPYISMADSIVYEYTGKQLKNRAFYRKYLEGDFNLEETCEYRWTGDNLTAIYAVSPDAYYNYTVSYDYSDTLCRAIPPYASVEFISRDPYHKVDGGSTFLVELANMGYYGDIPANQIRQVTIDYVSGSQYLMSFEYAHPAPEHCDVLKYTLTTNNSSQWMSGLVLHWNK